MLISIQQMPSFILRNRQSERLQLRSYFQNTVVLMYTFVECLNCAIHNQCDVLRTVLHLH